MLIGISFGLAACVLWGFTYLLPLLLPDYPTTYISVARGIVMGVTALAGLALQRQYLKQVNLKDWNTAFWLTLIGNLNSALVSVFRGAVCWCGLSSYFFRFNSGFSCSNCE